MVISPQVPRSGERQHIDIVKTLIRNLARTSSLAMQSRSCRWFYNDRSIHDLIAPHDMLYSLVRSSWIASMNRGLFSIKPANVTLFFRDSSRLRPSFPAPPNYSPKWSCPANSFRRFSWPSPMRPCRLHSWPKTCPTTRPTALATSAAISSSRHTIPRPHTR